MFWKKIAVEGGTPSPVEKNCFKIVSSVRHPFRITELYC